MRYVLCTAQIRLVEVETMDRCTVTALDLMEQAGGVCSERIMAMLAAGIFTGVSAAVVVVGMGNNGGDGLVIARRLHEAGIHVRVVRLLHRSKPSAEHVLNAEKWTGSGLGMIDIDHLSDPVQYYDNEIIIDSIFGTGLHHSPTGWIRDFIRRINASGRPVVSIDLPSGMIEVGNGAEFDGEGCIRADHTLTFEVPRLSLLLPETGPMAGEWEVLPIGLDPVALAAVDRLGTWVDRCDVQEMLLPRPRFGHKGTFGHACVVAGSEGMFGAAVLAVRGCLRSGVGLVTAHVPANAAGPLASIAPDALCSADLDPRSISKLPPLNRYEAVGIGPGLGQEPLAGSCVRALLQEVKVPVLLDADALNLLAQHPEWLQLAYGPVILTPHPKEMDRLLGQPSKSGFDRLRKTQAFAVEYGCTVVLKGAHTAICTPDGPLYFNSTGNVGMAKGGSGDVLTGLLTGLLAQGYAPTDACLIGVHLHGLAGDLAAARLGMDAMRPSDLIDALPEAWKLLRGTSEQAVQ